MSRTLCARKVSRYANEDGKAAALEEGCPLGVFLGPPAGRGRPGDSGCHPQVRSAPARLAEAGSARRSPNKPADRLTRRTAPTIRPGAQPVAGPMAAGGWPPGASLALRGGQASFSGSAGWGATPFGPFDGGMLKGCPSWKMSHFGPRRGIAPQGRQPTAGRSNPGRPDLRTARGRPPFLGWSVNGSHRPNANGISESLWSPSLSRDFVPATRGYGSRCARIRKKVCPLVFVYTPGSALVH